MYLIVGLGNPGEEYAHTRHNAGFDAVDALAGEIGVRYWKNECGALTGKGAWRDHDLLLAKPQSFMNTSGGPVKQLMNAYGVDAEHLVVIHDELDIDPGTIRVKFGGGHAPATTGCAPSATRPARATGTGCVWASAVPQDACPWWTGCCRSRRRKRPKTSRTPSTVRRKRRFLW